MEVPLSTILDDRISEVISGFKTHPARFEVLQVILKVLEEQGLIKIPELGFFEWMSSSVMSTGESIYTYVVSMLSSSPAEEKESVLGAYPSEELQGETTLDNFVRQVEEPAVEEKVEAVIESSNETGDELILYAEEKARDPLPAHVETDKEAYSRFSRFAERQIRGHDLMDPRAPGGPSASAGIYTPIDAAETQELLEGVVPLIANPVIQLGISVGIGNVVSLRAPITEQIPILPSKEIHVTTDYTSGEYYVYKETPPTPAEASAGAIYVADTTRVRESIELLSEENLRLLNNYVDDDMADIRRTLTSALALGSEIADLADVIMNESREVDSRLELFSERWAQLYELADAQYLDESGLYYTFTRHYNDFINEEFISEEARSLMQEALRVFRASGGDTRQIPTLISAARTSLRMTEDSRKVRFYYLAHQSLRCMALSQLMDRIDENPNHVRAIEPGDYLLKIIAGKTIDKDLYAHIEAMYKVDSLFRDSRRSEEVLKHACENARVLNVKLQEHITRGTIKISPIALAIAKGAVATPSSAVSFVDHMLRAGTILLSPDLLLAAMLQSLDNLSLERVIETYAGQILVLYDIPHVLLNPAVHAFLYGYFPREIAFAQTVYYTDVNCTSLEALTKARAEGSVHRTTLKNILKAPPGKVLEYLRAGGYGQPRPDEFQHLDSLSFARAARFLARATYVGTEPLVQGYVLGQVLKIGIDIRQMASRKNRNPHSTNYPALYSEYSIALTGVHLYLVYIDLASNELHNELAKKQVYKKPIPATDGFVLGFSDEIRPAFTSFQMFAPVEEFVKKSNYISQIFDSIKAATARTFKGSEDAELLVESAYQFEDDILYKNQRAAELGLKEHLYDIYSNVTTLVGNRPFTLYELDELISAELLLTHTPQSLGRVSSRLNDLEKHVSLVRGSLDELRDSGHHLRERVSTLDSVVRTFEGMLNRFNANSRPAYSVDDTDRLHVIQKCLDYIERGVIRVATDEYNTYASTMNARMINAAVHSRLSTLTDALSADPDEEFRVYPFTGDVHEFVSFYGTIKNAASLVDVTSVSTARLPFPLTVPGYTYAAMAQVYVAIAEYMTTLFYEQVYLFTLRIKTALPDEMYTQPYRPEGSAAPYIYDPNWFLQLRELVRYTQIDIEQTLHSLISETTDHLYKRTLHWGLSYNQGLSQFYENVFLTLKDFGEQHFAFFNDRHYDFKRRFTDARMSDYNPDAMTAYIIINFVNLVDPPQVNPVYVSDILSTHMDVVDALKAEKQALKDALEAKPEVRQPDPLVMHAPLSDEQRSLLERVIDDPVALGIFSKVFRFTESGTLRLDTLLRGATVTCPPETPVELEKTLPDQDIRVEQIPPEREMNEYVQRVLDETRQSAREVYTTYIQPSEDGLFTNFKESASRILYTIKNATEAEIQGVRDLVDKTNIASDILASLLSIKERVREEVVFPYLRSKRIQAESAKDALAIILATFMDVSDLMKKDPIVQRYITHPDMNVAAVDDNIAKTLDEIRATTNETEAIQRLSDFEAAKVRGVEAKLIGALRSRNTCIEAMASISKELDEFAQVASGVPLESPITRYYQNIIRAYDSYVDSLGQLLDLPPAEGQFGSGDQVVSGFLDASHNYTIVSKLQVDIDKLTLGIVDELLVEQVSVAEGSTLDVILLIARTIFPKDISRAVTAAMNPGSHDILLFLKVNFPELKRYMLFVKMVDVYRFCMTIAPATDYGGVVKKALGAGWASDIGDFAESVRVNFRESHKGYATAGLTWGRVREVGERLQYYKNVANTSGDFGRNATIERLETAFGDTSKRLAQVVDRERSKNATFAELENTSRNLELRNARAELIILKEQRDNAHRKAKTAEGQLVDTTETIAYAADLIYTLKRKVERLNGNADRGLGITTTARKIMSALLSWTPWGTTGVAPETVLLQSSYALNIKDRSSFSYIVDTRESLKNEYMTLLATLRANADTLNTSSSQLDQVFMGDETLDAASTIEFLEGIADLKEKLYQGRRRAYTLERALEENEKIIEEMLSGIVEDRVALVRQNIQPLRILEYINILEGLMVVWDDLPDIAFALRTFALNLIGPANLLAGGDNMAPDLMSAAVLALGRDISELTTHRQDLVREYKNTMNKFYTIEKYADLAMVFLQSIDDIFSSVKLSDLNGVEIQRIGARVHDIFERVSRSAPRVRSEFMRGFGEKFEKLLVSLSDEYNIALEYLEDTAITAFSQFKRPVIATFDDEDQAVWAGQRPIALIPDGPYILGYTPPHHYSLYPIAPGVPFEEQSGLFFVHIESGLIQEVTANISLDPMNRIYFEIPDLEPGSIKELDIPIDRHYGVMFIGPATQPEKILLYPYDDYPSLAYQTVIHIGDDFNIQPVVAEKIKKSAPLFRVSRRVARACVEAVKILPDTSPKTIRDLGEFLVGCKTQVPMLKYTQELYKHTRIGYALTQYNVDPRLEADNMYTWLLTQPDPNYPIFQPASEVAPSVYDFSLSHAPKVRRIGEFLTTYGFEVYKDDGDRRWFHEWRPIEGLVTFEYHPLEYSMTHKYIRGEGVSLRHKPNVEFWFYVYLSRHSARFKQFISTMGTPIEYYNPANVWKSFLIGKRYSRPYKDSALRFDITHAPIIGDGSPEEYFAKFPKYSDGGLELEILLGSSITQIAAFCREISIEVTLNVSTAGVLTTRVIGDATPNPAKISTKTQDEVNSTWQTNVWGTEMYDTFTVGRYYMKTEHFDYLWNNQYPKPVIYDGVKFSDDHILEQSVFRVAAQVSDLQQAYTTARETSEPISNLEEVRDIFNDPDRTGELSFEDLVALAYSLGVNYLCVYTEQEGAMTTWKGLELSASEFLLIRSYAPAIYMYAFDKLYPILREGPWKYPFLVTGVVPHMPSNPDTLESFTADLYILTSLHTYKSVILDDISDAEASQRLERLSESNFSMMMMDAKNRRDAANKITGVLALLLPDYFAGNEGDDQAQLG